MAKAYQAKKAFPCARSMVTPLPVLLVLMITFSSTMTAPQQKTVECPPDHETEPCYCTTTTDALNFHCWNLNTKRFVDILKTLSEERHPIKTMEVTNSDLPSLPNDAFADLQIEQLRIMGNNVSTIGETAFTDLGKSLKKLVISGNLLKEVPSASLSHLSSLEILDLRNNKISQLSEGAFSGTGTDSLRELMLEGNDIGRIDSLAFKECCRDLNILNMANNLISTIPSKAFISLSNLTLLNLQDNNIQTIGKRTFNGLHQLNTLDLSNNHISTIEDEAFNVSSMSSLVLKNNNLSQVTDTTFAGLEGSLEWLDLSHNDFDSVPTQALTILNIIRHLDLSHNEITQLQDDSLTPIGRHLRFVELDYNNIDHISPKAFQDLELEFLTLAHNNLTGMTSDTIQSSLESLYALDLSANPLICGCELQWLKQWLRSRSNRVGNHDPVCTGRGSKHQQLVRYQLACDKESTPQTPMDELHTCSGLECWKVLYNLLSSRITWYSY